MTLDDATLASVAATLTGAMLARHAGKPLTGASPEDQITVVAGLFNDMVVELRKQHDAPAWRAEERGRLRDRVRGS